MSTFHQPANPQIPLFVTGPRSDVASFTFEKGIAAEVDAMMHCTRQIFGKDVRLILEQDAEIDDDLHLLFEAKCVGEIDEVLEKENEWHDQGLVLAPNALQFLRLFVDIEP